VGGWLAGAADTTFEFAMKPPIALSFAPTAVDFDACAVRVALPDFSRAPLLYKTGACYWLTEFVTSLSLLVPLAPAVKKFP